MILVTIVSYLQIYKGEIMTNVLILGYGNIGKHIYDELKTMNPYIYDPNIPQYNNYPKINIDIAFVCVPTDSQADGSCDTSIVEKTIKNVTLK